jgi:hypothetical protein
MSDLSKKMTDWILVCSNKTLDFVAGVEYRFQNLESAINNF